MNHAVLRALDGKVVVLSMLGGSVVRGVLDTLGLDADSGTVHLDQKMERPGVTSLADALRGAAGTNEGVSEHWHHTVQVDQIASISWEGTHDE